MVKKLVELQAATLQKSSFFAILLLYRTQLSFRKRVLE